MNGFKTLVLVLFAIACVLVAVTVVSAIFSAFHLLIEIVVLAGLGYLAWHTVFRHRGSQKPQ